MLHTKKNTIELLRKRYEKCNYWLQQIGDCHDDLMEIMTVHKMIWNDGLRHPGFGPDRYGYFRTDDIDRMQPSDVYLGGVDGIWTNNIPAFEDIRNSEPDVYRRICRQYSGQLSSNVKHLRDMVYDNGFAREILMDMVCKACNLVSKTHKVDGVSFKEASIAGNRILHCNVRVYGYSIDSSMLNLNGRFLVPYGFEDGVNITKANYKDFRYYSPDEICWNGGKSLKLYDLRREDGVRRMSDSEKMTAADLRTVRKTLDERSRKGYGFGI